MKSPSILSLLSLGLASAATFNPREPNLPAGTGGTTNIYQAHSGAAQPAEGLRPLLRPQPSNARGYVRVGDKGHRGDFSRKRKSAVNKNGVIGKDTGNGKKLSEGKEYHTVHDPVDSGWHLFQFGTVRDEANPSFAIKTTNYIRLRITDMYYNGDRFAVYNVYNGITPELVLETPHVDSDSTQRRITDANAAFKSVGVWSHGEVILAPGKYHLVIKPRSSPFGGGTAAIRFDTVAELSNTPVGLVARTSDASVCPGYGGYVVVHQRVTSEHHQAVCQLLGLANADLDTEDREMVKALTRTINSCVGKEKILWIGAVNGEEREGRLGARYSEDSELQIVSRRPDEKHQVICAVRE